MPINDNLNIIKEPTSKNYEKEEKIYEKKYRPNWYDETCRVQCTKNE